MGPFHLLLLGTISKASNTLMASFWWSNWKFNFRTQQETPELWMRKRGNQRRDLLHRAPRSLLQPETTQKRFESAAIYISVCHLETRDTPSSGIWTKAALIL